jgi:hypothetical protein
MSNVTFAPVTTYSVSSLLSVQSRLSPSCREVQRVHVLVHRVVLADDDGVLVVLNVVVSELERVVRRWVGRERLVVVEQLSGVVCLRMMTLPQLVMFTGTGRMKSFS